VTDALTDQIRRALFPVPGGGAEDGDIGMNRHLAAFFSAARIPAAVLVPLVEREDGLHVMLTLRPQTMNQHAGQVCFPGGRTDANDATPACTALRETQEETGLPANRVEILGYLPDYVTRTGYKVTPVVGLVHLPVELTANPGEVDEIFEVPLDFFMEPANCNIRELQWEDKTGRFYNFDCSGHEVWGATAGMLVTLRNMIFPPAEPGAELRFG
jgi:8-oxo-dGTP pyrophosphatase MutT (NUDIX family)